MTTPGDTAPMSLVRDAARTLKAVSNSNAMRDAEMMLAHVLDIPISRLPLHGYSLTAAQQHAFQAMITRRLTGEPVAYIIGVQSFWSLDFIVNQHTLIPRPDTETLVEAGLEALAGCDNPRILDIGTGSGCVLLSLLSEIPAASGVGVDISNQAAAVATANAAANILTGRASFLIGDMFAPVIGLPLFDLIVSNPPYIPANDITYLMRDVKDFEPLCALDGGVDGYGFYQCIARESAQYLVDDGALAVEVGIHQAETVAGLLSVAGFKDISVKLDLNGIERVVCAKKY